MGAVKEEVKLAGVRMQGVRVKWRQIIGCSHVYSPNKQAKKLDFFFFFLEVNANCFLVRKRITTVPEMCFKTKP